VGLHLIAFLFLSGSLARRSRLPIEVSYIPEINGAHVAITKPPSALSHKTKNAEKISTQKPGVAASQNAGVKEEASHNVPRISGKGHAPSGAVERYLAEVADLLNSKKRYPNSAKRLGQQGRVIVQLQIARDGHVTDKKIVTPAPFESLNSAAQSLIDEIEGLRPFPREIDASTWKVTVPIEYRLSM
jgi:TonB family protein